ncbi:hypothetical protein BDR22DRAFT_970259 [Usnea florida]
MTDPSTEKRSTTTTKHPPTPPPQALVFDPSNPEQVTEETATEHNKAKNDFQVRLPRWSNRFAVFEEPQKKFGYMFTLRLDRLGEVREKTSYELWKVACASSAAPLYFRAMKLEDENPDSSLVEGRLGANNLSVEAWESIKQYSRNEMKTVDINASIGTGGIVNKASERVPMKKLYFFLDTNQESY